MSMSAFRELRAAWPRLHASALKALHLMLRVDPQSVSGIMGGYILVLSHVLNRLAAKPDRLVKSSWRMRREVRPAPSVLPVNTYMQGLHNPILKYVQGHFLAL